MDTLLEDYKAYYALREQKYADNPNYQNTWKAEKALSDAMQSCSTLEEFKDKIGNLNELCAVALVKDEAIIEQAFYEKHQEDIRKLASQRILEKVDAYTNVMDLVAMVTEEYNKNNIEISMDEAHRQLLYDWFLIDYVEIFGKAEVPDKYKAEMISTSEKYKQYIRENAETIEKNNDSWQKGWKIIPEMNLEFRHKRIMPYSEEIIREQIEKYKKIINR